MAGSPLKKVELNCDVSDGKEGWQEEQADANLWMRTDGRVARSMEAGR